MTAVGGRVRQSRLVRACEEKLFLPALGVKGTRWDIFPSVQALKATMVRTQVSPAPREEPEQSLFFTGFPATLVSCYFF